MQAQARFTKSTWSFTSRGGVLSKFTSTKNLNNDGEELNTLTTSAVSKDLKIV